MNNQNPKLLLQVQINVMDDNKIFVNNFPENYHTCMQIMYTAQKALIDHFMTKAREGGVDEMGNIGTSKIIIPKGQLMDMPDGRM